MYLSNRLLSTGSELNDEIAELPELRGHTIGIDLR